MEVLRDLFETWNRRTLTAFSDVSIRAVQFHPGLVPPGEGAEYSGRKGVMDRTRAVNDAWVRVTVEPGRRIEVASDRILAIDRWRFEGRDGIQVEEELPTAFTFRDGLIVRVDGFTDKAEAIEAAGLSE